MLTHNRRAIYGSIAEIREAWLEKWDMAEDRASRILLNEAGGHKLMEFRDAFDPTALYPMQWWMNYNFVPSDIGSFAIGGVRDSMLSFAIREPFINLLSFSVPCEEALTAITNFVGSSRIVEYMAGSGYWAWLLEKYFGRDVICVDNHSGHWNVTKDRAFMPIISGDTRDIEPPEEATIMMAWIPNESDQAIPLLKKMHRGQKFIYIGEPGGCTDSDNTQAFLDKYFTDISSVPIPQFYGIHDVCYFYEKK